MEMTRRNLLVGLLAGTISCSVPRAVHAHSRDYTIPFRRTYTIMFDAQINSQGWVSYAEVFKVERELLLDEVRYFTHGHLNSGYFGTDYDYANLQLVAGDLSEEFVERSMLLDTSKTNDIEMNFGDQNWPVDLPNTTLRALRIFSGHFRRTETTPI